MDEKIFKILAVDDTPENLDVIKGLLIDRYQVLGAINGAVAISLPLSPLNLLHCLNPLH
ncbi:MAG: hypothetical protein HN421_11110, partial [Gammaproteobacteria bacterium]|nr:hypothetical protein [Gammaproteobacteria bacterium]